MRPALKKTLWNLVLLAASLTIVFGSLEIGLRLSGEVPTNALRSPDLGTLDSIPGLFEPNQDFIDRLIPALAYRITTNSLGFRGPEFTRIKPAGKVRILCVGDSYTLGPYVPDDETMPGSLGRILELHRPGRTEVINGGANGFTIADELKFLETKALDLAPDIVILAFSQNDIRDLGKKRLTIDLMRDHATTKSRFLIGPTVQFLQHSALFNAMQRLAAWLKVRRRQAAAPELARAEPDFWDQYFDLLERTAEVTRSNGAKLMVVVWPSARQIDGADDLEPQAKLSDYCAGLEIPFLDLTPIIAELSSRGRKTFLLPLDGHPTGASYAAAAEAIHERLEELAWLPGSTAP